MGRVIPGTTTVKGREFRYLESPSKEAFADLFPRMGAIAKTPVPKSGGAISENTVITLPNGKRLFGLSYKGDIEGWRAELEQCSQALNIVWGEVTGSEMRLSNGEKFSLADCLIDFY